MQRTPEKASIRRGRARLLSCLLAHPSRSDAYTRMPFLPSTQDLLLIIAHSTPVFFSRIELYVSSTSGNTEVWRTSVNHQLHAVSLVSSCPLACLRFHVTAKVIVTQLSQPV